MNFPPHLLRRDLALVGGVTLLALVPLFFLLRKSLVIQTQQTPGATTSTLVPVVPRMSLGPNSSMTSAATISPDGHWLARMEVPASQLNVAPAPNSLSPVANELVIRSTRNGQEAFRALGVGKFVGWIPGTISFVSQNGDAISVFAPAVRKPGAPPPAQPWVPVMISFTPDPGGMATSMGANGAVEFELQAGAIVFSPDYRFAVKGSWGNGTIVWEVADLLTGKVAPPVTVGRWLNYDPNVGGFSNNISIAVAPASIASGALPIVSVLQSLEHPPESATPTPRPSPTPFVAPTPTPTLSPAQTQFKAKEAQESAAIQNLVEGVEGVDGADPKVTDEAEIAHITAEVRLRNHALEVERERLFPPTPTPKPTPGAPESPWSLEPPFRVETFDLNSKKRLWQSTVHGDVFPPQMKFAPDGSSLLVWGTGAEREQDGNATVDGVGIEFRAARSGKLMGKSWLYEDDFGIPEQSSVAVYADPSAIINGTPRSVFVFKDSYEGMRMPSGKFEPYQRGAVFRFFNASNAHETGYLKVNAAQIPPDQQTFSSFSISQGGSTWLWGDSDIFLLSRGELGQEASRPLPAPTPDPSLVRSTHASGH